LRMRRADGRDAGTVHREVGAARWSS
jgi:hypothetical protein